MVVLLCGCFTEGGSDSGSGPGDDASASSSESGAASSVGSNSVSETTAGSQSGSASTTTGDATDTGAIDTGPDDTGEPACGGLGEACCADSCDEGACHLDRCVVFAGAYAEPMTCGGCTMDASGMRGEIPPSFMPYVGGCQCPDGFATSDPLPTTSDYCPEDGLLHTPTALRTCTSADPPASSDWTGVYVTSSVDACVTGADKCVVANAVTGGCGCPGGNAEMIASTWAPCGADAGDQPLDIHVCVPTDVDAISFAGAYQTHWTVAGRSECASPNPRTAECSCPNGFVGEPLRITSPVPDNGGEIFFCVRY